MGEEGVEVGEWGRMAEGWGLRDYIGGEVLEDGESWAGSRTVDDGRQ